MALIIFDKYWEFDLNDELIEHVDIINSNYKLLRTFVLT